MLASDDSVDFDDSDGSWFFGLGGGFVRFFIVGLLFALFLALFAGFGVGFGLCLLFLIQNISQS